MQGKGTSWIGREPIEQKFLSAGTFRKPVSSQHPRSPAAQDQELSNAVASDGYREVVTKAKNIVEGIIAEKIGSIGKGRDLFGDLQAIKRVLEDNLPAGGVTLMIIWPARFD